MKKIKIFSILTLLIGALGFNSSTIFANSALETKTDLGITIDEVDGPVDPTDPWDPTQPEKPGVDEGENDGSSNPNPEIGSAKLGIWRIPGNMEFEGKMDFTNNYTLGLSGATKQRVISVADVRGKNDTNWKLSGKLTDLESESGDKITSGYKLKFGRAEAKKHLVEGNKIYAKKFEEDSNGVSVNSQLELNKADTEIASAVNGKGKGYTGILFNDISLEFDAGVGTNDTYSGQVIWTLSSTVN